MQYRELPYGYPAKVREICINRNCHDCPFNGKCPDDFDTELIDRIIKMLHTNFSVTEEEMDRMFQPELKIQPPESGWTGEYD